MQISIAPCSDIFLCSCTNRIPIVLLSYIFCVVMSHSFLKLSRSFCFFLLLFCCSYLLLLLDFLFFTFFFFLLFIGIALTLSLVIGLSLLLSIRTSLSSFLLLSIELLFVLSIKLSFVFLVKLLLAISVKLLLEFLLLSVPSTGLVEPVPRLSLFLARFRTWSRRPLDVQMKLGSRRRLLVLGFVQPIFLMNLNVSDCSVFFYYYVLGHLYVVCCS